MPNIIDANGLQTATREELVTQYTTDFQTIYGPDVNLDQDSPDGQMINIFIQSVLDLSDLLRQIYNGFDPDLAVGVTLDERVAINGIQRQAGTFTITNITVVTSQALNLYGLDQDTQPVFTVSDNAGNLWELQETENVPGSGTYVLIFQAAVPGAVLTTPNTITVPVTIVLGVTSVNNPTTYTSLGINEETDAAFKIRRQRSVSIASQGYLKGLLAALENINGVTSAFVYENNSNAIDVDGVPGHSIWVIVAGTGAPEEIANAIYQKRNAGCGMFGDIEYEVTQVDSTVFLVKWSDVESEELFIKFTATSIDGINLPNIAAIRSGLVESFVPGVFQEVDINHLATKVQDIDPNCLVTDAGFGLTALGPFTNTLTPSAKNKQFSLQAPDIIIIPMQLLPVLSSIAASGSQQMTALGGFGAYTYSLLVNNSGGSINGSGLYTAGATNGVIDTVKVLDTQGNIATAQVTVT